MANTIRIKKRAASGSAGSPSSLSPSELAFNENDLKLYYGFGVKIYLSINEKPFHLIFTEACFATLYDLPLKSFH